jgi:hypothetical protein
MEYLVLAPPAAAEVWVAEASVSRGLIIRLIIQTIRRDPSESVWIDEAPNLSSEDPSGADQSDVEHQPTDLAVRSPAFRLAGQACAALAVDRHSGPVIGDTAAR